MISPRPPSCRPHLHAQPRGAHRPAPRAATPRLAGCALAAALFAMSPAPVLADCVGGTPNGTFEAGEGCDDGNLSAGDGCDATCLIEAGWSCDTPVVFTTITPESYPGASANWVIAADGRSAEQTANTSHGTIGLFNANAKAATFTFTIWSTNTDNDHMGFVVGFMPGDTTNASADYLLIDWDQSNTHPDTGLSTAGLAVSRVRGIPTFTDLFYHTGTVTEIARASVSGSTGWVRNQMYAFQFSYTSASLRVLVDGVEELNLSAAASGFSGGFPEGEIGFFGASQSNVNYRIDGPFGASSCNRAPTVADQTVARTLGDALTVVDVLAGFSDPDGDSPNGASAVALTLPTAGTVTDPTSGAADGTLELVPDDPNASISYAFTFQLCDDHPTVPLCDVGTITVVTCGDGVVGFGESCDDGYADACGTCNETCTGPGTGSCGDGEVCPETETCDDGYADACGTCNDDCTGPGTAPVCGDGIHCEELEACDDGFTDACGSCNADCTDVGAGATCGDSAICTELEACDDGNTDPNDGCSAECVVETDGGMPDAGPMPGEDGGPSLDGGVNPALDGATPSLDGGPPGASGHVVGGLSCRAALGARSRAPYGLVLLAALALWRRRRRHPS